MIRGITCSAFDLLHAGHIVMLEEAKTQCDYLICALQIDPSLDRPDKNKPVQSIVERQIQLKAVKYVDEVIVYDTEESLKEIFSTFDLQVRIIGEEYYNEPFTGKDICEERGITIYYNTRKHGLSTSALRTRTYDEERLQDSDTEL